MSKNKKRKLKALERLVGMFKTTKSTPIADCNGYKYVKKIGIIEK